MKTKPYLNIVIVLLCGAFAVAQESAPATTVTAPISGATISDFKGKVTIQLPGQALIGPTRGQVLPPETTVNTDDGRLLLRLTDGSDVLVRPHTRVIIKEPESSAWRYLQLLIGRIRTQVQKHLGGTPSFQIGTPSAVISVRGTQFDVEVNRHGFTEVDVTEGVVELESTHGRGESVLITAGFSSRVGIDSGPEVPRPTHELRPQLDRPRAKDDRDYGDDDAIRRLESSSHDGGSGGSSGSGDSGDRSGSGGTSGSDDGGLSSSGSGDRSGSDGGTSSSGSGDQLSGSDGGSHSGSDGGSHSGSDGGSSSTSDGGHDRHGGKPPK